MDSREIEIDGHLRTMRGASARVLRPTLLILTLVIVVAMILGVLWSMFVWVAGHAWSDEASGVSARYFFAVTVQAVGASVLTTLMGGMVWVAVTGSQIAIQNLVYKIIAEPSESLEILRFQRREIERVTKTYTVVGTAVVILGLVLFLRAGGAEEKTVNAVVVSMMALVIGIATVSHYHALRRARLYEGGFRRGLDLQFGFVPTLSGALQSVTYGIIVVLGIPQVALPLGTSMAVSLNRIPAGFIESFDAATSYGKSAKAELLYRFRHIHGARPARVEVTAEILNVRDQPSTAASKVFSLPRGSDVAVLDSTLNWYRVRTAQGEGWISARYAQSRSMADDGFFSLVRRVIWVAELTILAAGIVLIVAPVVILKTGSITWSFVVSVLCTLAGNAALRQIEAHFGPQNPSSVPIVLFSSLVSMLVGVVLTRDSGIWSSAGRSPAGWN